MEITVLDKSSFEISTVYDKYDPIEADFSDVQDLGIKM
jgi:hypothetical protein